MAAGQEPTGTNERFQTGVKELIASLTGQASLPWGWQEATIAGVEPLADAQAGMHLCKLKQPGGKVGYVVFADRQGQLHPVMFSGVLAPARLLQTLSVGANYDPGVLPSGFAGELRILMIAPVDRPATQKLSHVATSPVACALASVLYAVSSRERLPLFVERMGAHAYIDALSRWLERSGNARAATAMRAGLDQVRSLESLERSGRYLRERRRVAVEGGHIEKTAIWPHADPGKAENWGGPIKDSMRYFEATFPCDRDYLKGRITPAERVIGLENEGEEAPTQGLDTSFGMRLALTLELRYLKNTASIEEAIDLFCLMRGLRVASEREAIDEVVAGDLPCVLLGPENQAMVLIALGRGGTTNWGLVYVPETVIPFRKSLADLFVERAAQTRPGITPAEVEREIAISDEARRDITVIDPMLCLPDASKMMVPYRENMGSSKALLLGAHVVNLHVCQGAWRALVLRDWQLRDNWDFEPAK